MTNMQMTGRNFLHALGIACLIAGVLGGIFALMAVIGDTLADAEPYSLGESLPRAFFVFRWVFLMSGPVVLIIAFAVLQRLRIKNNL